MSKLNRRSILAGAVSVPILASAIVTATADHGIADDTLSRIADHRDAIGMLEEMCKRTSDLEQSLPADRRVAHSIYDRGTAVGANDDPRWTAVQAEYWAAVDRADEIAWSFIDRPPTTGAGVVALMAYASEHVEAGYEWPDSRHRFVNNILDETIAEQWEMSLITVLGPIFARAVA